MSASKVINEGEDELDYQKDAPLGHHRTGSHGDPQHNVPETTRTDPPANVVQGGKIS